MNVGTFKLNCYLEGIRVPIINFSSSYERNGISFGTITIPISGRIDGQMFANAFVQITVIDNTREKLVYQGLCIDMIVYEAESKVELTLQSLWGIFNFNTTLDYVSPRKYGLLNLEETLTLYVGNEEKVASPDFGLAEPSYRLSNRYFFVEADKETSQIEYNDVDANKLEFIITRIPFAERFAFSFFEQMAYGNFILTKAHAERFNLLNKIEAGQRIKKAEITTKEELELTFGVKVDLDQTRSAFAFKNLKAGTVVSGDNDLEKPSNPISSPDSEGISEIILHVTAGSFDDTVESVRSFHMNERGFPDIRYNWLIYKDGSAHAGVAEGKNSGSTKDSAHNKVSVAICYASPAGTKVNGKMVYGNANDPYGKWMTEEQKTGFAKKVAEVMKKYNIPFEKVLGHNQIQQEPCPCFSSSDSTFINYVKKYL